MIRVLHVDDLSARRKQLADSLADLILRADVELIGVSTSVEAVAILTSQKIDVLVLDLCFPTRPGQLAEKRNGLVLAQHVMAGSLSHIPEHILGVSLYDDSLAEAADEFEAAGRPLIKVNGSTSDWCDSVLALCVQVLRARRPITEFRSDAVILTAQFESEFEELLAAAEDVGLEVLGACNIGRMFVVSSPSGRDMKIAIAACAQMGAVDTAALSAFMISRWSPRFIAMSGIAAAVGNQIQLADVLVATSAWDVESGKASEDERGNRIFSRGPSPIALPSWVQAELVALSRSEPLLAKSMRGEGVGGSKLAVHCGPMAMVNRVVAQSGITEEMLDFNRRMVGLEMESYALFRAAEIAPEPRPIPILVKGVSDFATPGKGDSVRRLASRRSARLLLSLLGGLVDRAVSRAQ